MAEWTLFQWIIQIVAFPFQLYQFVVNSALDFVAFEVLNLDVIIPLLRGGS